MQLRKIWIYMKYFKYNSVIIGTVTILIVNCVMNIYREDLSATRLEPTKLYRFQTNFKPDFNTRDFILFQFSLRLILVRSTTANPRKEIIRREFRPHVSGFHRDSSVSSIKHYHRESLFPKGPPQLG